MNEGEELDGDAFEIIDHTIASPWERFVARIEEVIRNWITQGVIGNHSLKEEVENEQQVLEETISHAGRSYLLAFVNSANREFDDPKYAHLPQRLSIFMDTLADFALQGHDVQRWFGVEAFIALWPLADSATDMSEASLLLSSLSIAADSSQCFVPLFVPIGERYEGRYMGYMIEDGYCVRFLCENYQSGTKQGQFGNMENLVEYFHKQLNANNKSGGYKDLTPFTTVATRFTYTREDWFDEWRGIHVCEICEEEKQRLAQESPKANIHLSTNFRANSDIYWGPLSDPLSALQLAAVWQHDSMPKNRFWADNKIRSDFKPNNAPIWNLQAAFRDFEKACPLTLSLRVLLTSYVEAMEAPSLHLFSKPEEGTEQQKEKEGKQGLVSVMETLTKTLTSLNSPVVPSQQELESIVRDLFSKSSSSSSSPSEDEDVASGMALHQVRALNLKPAPPFTLAADLACRMLDMQCLPAIALLWIEFVKEVRWSWDHCIPLPRVPFDSQIDTSACLIFQKLQMMNYCINRKAKERKKKKPKATKTEEPKKDVGRSTPTPKKETVKKTFDGWDEFDEEPVLVATKSSRRKSDDFFSILNDTSTTTTTTTTSTNKEKEGEEEVVASPDGWDDGEIEGLSSESEVEDSDDFQDAKSEDNEKQILSLDGWDDLSDLDHTTQYLLYRENPMVAPETQDSGIMTEDMLKEQMEIFKSLGTSEEAALIRAKLQTPSLKSDMESFKAANEGCVLEDFVRWYSPRDWVTPDSDNFDLNVIKESDKENGGEIRGKGMGRDGHLSSRMRLPGNLWRQMWKEAEAVPASKQTPLFKHIVEAEKVMHYLENISLPDLVQQIISIVLNVILYNFKPSSMRAQDEEANKRENKKIVVPHTHTTPPQGVDLPPFVQSFEDFIRAIDAYWHESYSTEFPIQVENLTNLWQEFQQLECMAAKATSLLQKMPGKFGIVSDLLLDEEVAIPKNLRGDFSPIFFPDNGDSVSADTREYVIRCPGHKSEFIPNRLYACVSAHEAKVATVFALDE